MSMLLYLDDQWPRDWGAETLFLDDEVRCTPPKRCINNQQVMQVCWEYFLCLTSCYYISSNLFALERGSMIGGVDPELQPAHAQAAERSFDIRQRMHSSCLSRLWWGDKTWSLMLCCMVAD